MNRPHATDRGHPIDVEPLLRLLMALLPVAYGCLEYKFARAHGLTVTQALVPALCLAGAAILCVVMLLGGGSYVMRTVERYATYRIFTTFAAMGPRLIEWRGYTYLAELTRADIHTWRRAHERGLTPEEAQTWSDRGLSYTVADAARRDGLTLAQALTLAATLRDTGLWDPARRRDLDLILFERPLPERGRAGTGRIRKKWLSSSPDRIRATARAVLGDPDAVAARLDERRDELPGSARSLYRAL